MDRNHHSGRRPQQPPPAPPQRTHHPHPQYPQPSDATRPNHHTFEPSINPRSEFSDPFADMRGQFEREFYEPNQNHPGFFRHPFMDGFGPSFNLGRGFPAEDDRDFPQFHARQPDMRSHSPRPSNDEVPHKTSRAESIPIRVVHEKNPAGSASPKAKHPAMSRNTTELPAKGTTSDQPDKSSPRITRASSEPPKTFQKHLSQMKQPPNHHYSSIPEGGVLPSDSQSDQLHVPSAPGGSNNPNNLATSASAPSVPTSSQPEAPQHLRRSEVQAPTPRGLAPKTASGASDNRKQSAPPTMMNAPPGVRHIPIFVEGRDEPVVNRSASVGGPAASGRAGGFVKPSDCYPNGTQKVSRGEVHPQRMHMNLPTQEQQRKAPTRSNEPTSPVSPPPGPIPMGWVPPPPPPPQKVVPGDPTSPLPAPDGPIPLPCSPNYYKASPVESKAGGKEQLSNAAPSPQAERKQTMVPPPKNPVPNVSPLDGGAGNDTTDSHPHVPQERGGGPEDPALSKMEKIQAEVSALIKKIEEFKGNKKDKEYLYLDEMLTRHLIALDEIDTGGRNELRQMRKESIKSINRCLSMLDSRAKNESAKANTNNGNDQKIAKESDAAQTNNQILSDLAALSSSNSANKAEEVSNTAKKD